MDTLTLEQPMAKNAKVPVSERALVARINRKLEGDSEAIRRCRRDSKGWSELGDYYLIDLEKNCLIAKDVDLQDFARKLGVLANHEALGEDDQ
jgi:hypothetical protein